MKSEKSCHVRPWMRFLGYCTAAILIGALFAPARAQAAALILNEYNAVDNAAYLNGGSYKADLTKEDTYFGTVPGMPDGRLEGNGGNWIELVVIQDHLDIRDWQLKWAETGAIIPGGTNDIWYGDPTVEQGVITFSPTADIWADLRSGTIITISEKDDIGVDTDWDLDLDDRNFTDGVSNEDEDVIIPLATDISYDPIADDWWIHIGSREEAGNVSPLITTETNVEGDSAGDFSVGPADWELSVFNATGALDFGPIGEDIDTFGVFSGGVNDEEAGRLEADPAANVNNDYFDDVTSTTFGQPNEWGGFIQDFSQLRSSAVPEPGTFVLLATAGLVVLLWRRRRRRVA